MNNREAATLIWLGIALVFVVRKPDTRGPLWGIVRSFVHPKVDFLTYFSWPEDENGERLRWTSLPVMDKLWRLGRADKGGFIQELTGWKPSPLQRLADVDRLAVACDLRGPSAA